MGGRKLYFKLRSSLVAMGVKIGRDAFFKLLREKDLLVKPKRNFTITTRSFERIWKYEDFYNGKVFKAPNQAWVSDITYLRVDEGFEYLTLITDAYSRKIVGWELGETLETKWTYNALKKAIKGCKNVQGVIHHSDRGFQYTSKMYTEELINHKMLISMGECGNCYDNAMAERMNGILKDEYSLDAKFKSHSMALRAVKQAIELYNTDRPHMALAYRTPIDVHHAA
jgi:putative transposase